MSLQSLSQILSRPVSEEKLNQVCEFISVHNRSDADVISEQVPNLLQLISELGPVSEEGSRKILKFFGSASSPFFHSIGDNVPFVFPLTKVLTKIVTNSSSLQFVHYMASRGDFVNLAERTINMKSLDYYFFAFAVLPILPVAPTTQQDWSKSSAQQAGWSNWSYQQAQKPSVYSQLLEQYVAVAVSDNYRLHDGRFIRGCQLMLGAVIDFWGLEVFKTDGGKNVLTLLSVVMKVVFKSNSGSKLGNIFVDRLGRLLADLFMGSAEKWLNRIDLETVEVLIHLWVNYCQPWKSSSQTSISSWDAHIRRNAYVYNCYPLVLRIGAVRDFVADYVEAFSNGEKSFAKFLNGAKVGVEIFVSVLEVLQPELLSVLAKTSDSSLCKDETNASEPVVSVTRQIWAVARECTWHNHSVPKNLTDESWRMDKMVNAVKGEKFFQNLFELFVWEQSNEGIGVPKNLTPPVRPKMVQDAPLEFAWNLPICAWEYAWVVSFVRRWTEILVEIDLTKNPTKFAFLRKMGDVGFLILMEVAVWIYTGSSNVWGVHLAFAILLVSMIYKWIRSMYVV